MNAMMNAHYKNDIPLKRNVKAYLRQLQADGVHICVASATAKPLMEACLKRLGIRSCFDFILSCEDMNTSKREPAVYLEAARRFGTVSENIAVYEDVLYAVQTAKNANFHTVAVYDEASDSDWEEICRIADETVNFN